VKTPTYIGFRLTLNNPSAFKTVLSVGDPILNDSPSPKRPMSNSTNPEAHRPKATHFSGLGICMKEKPIPQLCKTIAAHTTTIRYLLARKRILLTGRSRIELETRLQRGAR
jgi:hypothetical protein